MTDTASNNDTVDMPDTVVCERIRTNGFGFLRRIKISKRALVKSSGQLQDITRTVDRYFDTGKTDISVDILKSDHFSSVIRVQGESVDLVIKKEHARSKLEFLTKGLRKSRAAKAWEKAQLLAAKNLDIACPVALIEDFFLFFRTNAYFVCTYLPGTLLRTYLDDPEIADTEKKRAAQKTIDTIYHWHSLGVIHGDPKASNIIINNNQLHLIDTEDVSCHPPEKQKTRAMARDWAIVVHNWQNQPDIRQMALNRILAFFKTGQHQLATRLIKKFWKTEPLATNGSGFKETDVSPVVKKLATGKLPAGWERQSEHPALLNAVFRGTGRRCIFTRKGVPSAKQPADYFRKKRLPHRGIFSMARCMKICGFHLPEIIAGGLYGKHEYLLFNIGEGESLPGILKKIPVDDTEMRNLLILLGSEIGRFHAMGFIHGDLSLNAVRVEKTVDGYDVVFLPGPHTRRSSFMSVKKKGTDWLRFKGDITTLLPAKKATLIFDAYEKASLRK